MEKVYKDVLYPELSYKVCGLCFRIHNELGRFYNELQYADALENLFKIEKVEYKREIPLPPSFNGENERRNIPDFIIQETIILDLKAKRIITKDDYYQMKRYLNAYNKELGLIVNFREYYLSPKRVLSKNNLN
ncbi:GxxExxY protein [Patescibacteria group bacterium]|nr:GxxExxY protein [Patescibacteria group bacterium]MBU4458387.1 GxxExxY protein [Patescibacteria group bacterium]MCG2695858.1 GxxExxY protein [Candidatus Portnoybacteria bacterium]